MKLNKKHIAGIVLAVLAVVAAALSIFLFGHEGEWIVFCITSLVVVVFSGLLCYMYGKKIRWCIAGFLVLYCVGLCVDTLPRYIFFHKYNNENVITNLQNKRISFDELGGLNVMFDGIDIILEYHGRKKRYEIDEISPNGTISVTNQIPADDMVELFGDHYRRYLANDKLDYNQYNQEKNGNYLIISSTKNRDFNIAYCDYISASAGGPAKIVFQNSFLTYIFGGHVIDLW